jgi:hypothetical protein
MRVIGMDIHRTFAEVVMIDGDKLTARPSDHVARTLGCVRRQADA